MKNYALIFSMIVPVSSAFALGAQAPDPEDNGKIVCIAKPMYSSRPSSGHRAAVKGRPQFTEAEARSSALSKCRADRARSCRVVACSVIGALTAEEILFAE